MLLMLIGGVFAAVVLVVGVGALFVRDRQVVRALWTVLLTQVVIVGAVLIPAYLGGIFFTGALMLIGLRALWELLRLYPIPLAMKVCGVLGGALVFGSAHFFYQPYVAILALALALMVVALFMDLPGAAFSQAGLVVLSVIYTCVLLAHVIWVRQLDEGFALVVFLYGVSEVNDGFALVFGKLLGRRPAFPNLSPKKTLEGSLCGAVAACVVALVFQAMVGVFSQGQALLGAGLVVLGSLVGDLAASRIKREAGVKDYGQVLPMQGGVLDMYDALIFTAPLFWAFLWVLGFWR